MKLLVYNMNNIEGSKNECQDRIWFCKPMQVCNININEIDLLYSEIELGNIFQNAEMIEFSKEIKTSIDKSILNSADIERLHMFFGLFKINSENLIKTGKLTISYPKDQNIIVI